MSTLTGKVALVTGSSRGIGRAIAERLGRDGAKVVVNYAGSAGRAREVVANIEAAGGEAIAVQADVSKPDDIRRLFDEAFRQYGRLDILVNNAGTATYKPVSETTDEDFDKTFNLNARGTFFCLREGARRISDGGRIISLSSSATHMGYGTASFYSGSKAAVEQFSFSLAKELGARNITVNVVSPGLTDTDMLQEAGGDQMRKLGEQLSPLGRLGKPEDVADVVAFVAGPDGRWLTGQNIQAGGGVVHAF